MVVLAPLVLFGLAVGGALLGGVLAVLADRFAGTGGGGGALLGLGAGFLLGAVPAVLLASAGAMAMGMGMDNFASAAPGVLTVAAILGADAGIAGLAAGGGAGWFAAARRQRLTDRVAADFD